MNLKHANRRFNVASWEKRDIQLQRRSTSFVGTFTSQKRWGKVVEVPCFGLRLLTISGVWLLTQLAGMATISAQSPGDFVKQISSLEREADKAIDELLKIVSKPERNSRQQWHRVCDGLLQSIDSIDAKAPGHRAIIQRERKDWETIKSVGGEMVKINFEMEVDLKLVAKEALQAARDIEAWKKESVKVERMVVAELIKIENNVDDLATLANAAVGIESTLADGIKDIGSLALVAKDRYNKTKKIYTEAFTDSRAKREEYFEKTQANVRSNRRRLERLIAVKMIPESERPKLTKLEDQLEKVVLERLLLYQNALDNWVEVASPLNRSFQDFMHDVVGDSVLRVVKKLESVTLGTYFITVAAVASGDLIENFLDAFGNRWRVAALQQQKDSALKLKILLAERQTRFQQEQQSLEVQRESRLAKARADSQKVSASWKRQIEELRTSLTRVPKDSLEHGHILDRIQDFSEQVEVETDALDRELKYIDKDCDVILARLRQLHEASIKQINEAAK